MASFPQTAGFPQPGQGLYEVDRITILGVTLPLAKSPEGALELDVDKKKEPGSDFATYVALEEHLAPTAGRDWRRWPRALRDPASPAVEDFRRRHAVDVDRAQWVQFELDRQLGTVAARARRAGLAIGVYQDVALGSATRGADTWAFPGRFVLDGTSLGAPRSGR